MRYICKRLLNDIVGGGISCKHEEQYNRLVQYSSHYPNVDLQVVHTLIEIEKQWVTIARVIINECRENQIIPTLFAATKNIMETYAKVDSEIPRYHAMWLDAVIEELENRRDSSFFYFLLFSILIYYISK